jgi:hypothetical protein
MEHAKPQAAPAKAKKPPQVQQKVSDKTKVQLHTLAKQLNRKPETILHLQRTIGNHAVRELLKKDKVVEPQQEETRDARHHALDNTPATDVPPF